MNAPTVDGVLIQWGERLFYPGNRIVKSPRQPRLSGRVGNHRAQWVRQRIEAIVRRAPQVMVKVTGGGRGMRAIAAHFRYISKNGRLELIDDRDNKREGKESLRELAEEWRFGGSYIPEASERREAFNIMLSMPRGTDPNAVLEAAREFARDELADHAYVMVLHDHQANPHVHLSVRAESRHGARLNPRKADLHRWRETFAERLRDRGIDAEATRQFARGVARGHEALWRLRARDEGRVRNPKWSLKPRSSEGRKRTSEAWENIAFALSQSPEPTDQRLAATIVDYMGDVKNARERKQSDRVFSDRQPDPLVRDALRDRPSPSGPEPIR